MVTLRLTERLSPQKMVRLVRHDYWSGNLNLEETMYFSLLVTSGVLLVVFWIISRIRTANERALAEATRCRYAKLASAKPIRSRERKQDEQIWHDHARQTDCFK